MTELYRHYDEAGRLLYVGISWSSIARFAAGHRQRASWAERTVRIDIERFPSRGEALEAERRAIAEEEPLHNGDAAPLVSMPSETRVFNPAPEHDAAIRAAWHDEDRTITGVLKIAKRLGYTVEIHHLKHRYGNRFKDSE